jgi:hypothetical protein
MTAEQGAAFINAQAVAAFIKASGMIAANRQHPDNEPYTEKDFQNLSEEYIIDYNNVIGFYQQSCDNMC